MNIFTVKISNNYNNILFVNNDEEITIDTDIIKKHKFFHNDSVQYDKNTKKIKILNTNIKKQTIIGILTINTKMIYGFNSKKNPYYLFRPLHNYYPNFYVAINDKKLKNKNGKYYITVQFNEWKKKLPSATLKKFIGPIGEKNNEIQKLLYFYNIDTRFYKLKQKIKQNNTIYDIFNNDDLKNIKKVNFKIFSVDPKGSRDIDDALSIQYKDNNKIVGIHIADVSTWFFKFKLDFFIRDNRFFTVYLKDKKFNLFPNLLADNFMSLIQNKDRLALSLYITFNQDNEIIDYHFENNIINVEKNFSYEKFNQIIHKHNHFKDLFELSKLLKLGQNTNHFDSHNMIENYMILTNKITAEYLIKNNKKPILRCHKETKYNIDFNNIDNQKLKHFLKIFQTKSAEYKYYNENTDFNYYHYGLNLNLYAHFTSPIRRVIDIINHIKIKELLFHNYQDFYVDIDKVNLVNKNLRKLDRELDQIHNLDNILNKELDSFLVDYKDNFLYMYIPKINYYFKKKIYKNDDLITNLVFNIKEKSFKIINKNTNKFIELHKFFSYQICISKLLNSNEFYYNIINIDFQKII